MSEEIEIRGKKIPKELIAIIIKRIEAMPPNIKLAVLGKVLTKEDILTAIKNNTSEGREILEIEIDYYKDLMRD